MNEFDTSSLFAVALISTFSILILVAGIIIIIIRHQKKMMQNKLDLQNVQEEYQKKLLLSSVSSQERERERIARDLHDEIGASLSAAKLTMNLNVKKKEVDQAAWDKVNEILDHTIQNVKDISRNLIPVNLRRLGLTSAINGFCHEILAEDCTIKFEEHGDSRRLDAEIELGIFRIAQELISNAIQHSQAKTIVINLHWSPDSCKLEVADDGVGFNNEESKNSKGLGMDNIHTRTQTIGGTFTFENQKGTKANLIVPLKSNNL